MSGTRKITVTKTWMLREGDKDGKPWKLSGVEADDSDGNRIEGQLKTFANLPLGEVDVEVERQEHEQYGTSYLLKLPGKGGGGGAAAAGVAELRGRIEKLESEVARLSSVVDRRQPDDGTPAPAAAAPGIPDDSDIPF